MIRPVVSLMALVLLTTAVGAQAPEGWRVRIDRSQNAQDPDDVANITVKTLPNGFQVTGGPAGTFWTAGSTGTGAYTVRANFTLVKPSNHTNYYGLILGGSNLDGADQAYQYFLVAQTGEYLIRQRKGDQVTDVKARMMHESVRRPDASGRSVNALEVRVTGDAIAYVVNGTVVHTMPKAGATVSTDGLAGVRINHLLDVQVEGFQIQKG